MKKIIALVAVALVTVSMVCAQKGIAVGGGFGLHLNSSTKFYFDDAKPYGGFYGSLFGRYNFPSYEPLGVQVELNLANNGEGYMLYRGLDLPILATYDLNLWRFTFTFKLGPHFHFALSQWNTGGFPAEKYGKTSGFSLGMGGGVMTTFNINEKHGIGININYLHDFIPMKWEGAKIMSRGAIDFGLYYQYKF